MGSGSRLLEDSLFSGFNPVAHLDEHPIHELLDVDLGEYGDPMVKQATGVWTNVDPTNAVPFAVELDDLLRLHYLVLSRRVTTVLEFGVGKSTSVLAHALAVNEETHADQVASTMRRSNPFELHSVDNDAGWIEVAAEGLPKPLRNRCRLHHCPLEIGHFDGRLCTYYRNLPNLAPDLIYLDGPDLFSAEGDLRGLTTAHPDRMPMSADILVFEHFLTPGTLIVVDGRTANARFLLANLQRNWSYWHATEFDQHFFELAEAPLGPYNARQIDYCLEDSFSGVSAF